MKYSMMGEIDEDRVMKLIDTHQSNIANYNCPVLVAILRTITTVSDTFKNTTIALASHIMKYDPDHLFRKDSRGCTAFYSLFWMARMERHNQHGAAKVEAILGTIFDLYKLCPQALTETFKCRTTPLACLMNLKVLSCCSVQFIKDDLYPFLKYVSQICPDAFLQCNEDCCTPLHCLCIRLPLNNNVRYMTIWKTLLTTVLECNPKATEIVTPNYEYEILPLHVAAEWGWYASTPPSIGVIQAIHHANPKACITQGYSLDFPITACEDLENDPDEIIPFLVDSYIEGYDRNACLPEDSKERVKSDGNALHACFYFKFLYERSRVLLTTLPPNHPMTKERDEEGFTPFHKLLCRHATFESWHELIWHQLVALFVERHHEAIHLRTSTGLHTIEYILSRDRYGGRDMLGTIYLIIRSDPAQFISNMNV